MKDIKAFLIFLFVFGIVHFPSLLLANLKIHSLIDVISPTAWELRKTRRIFRELGYDPEYLSREAPELDINELAIAVNDPALILTMNRVAGHHAGSFEDIKDWDLYEEFFYAIFDPRKKRQADSLFDVLKKDVDNYINAAEEGKKTGAGPDFDFFKETEDLKKNRSTIVIEQWVNETRQVEEGLSEYSAQFNLFDFVAVVVGRFDRIVRSASVTDAPQLLRRYLFRVGGEGTIDEKIFAVFSSLSYRPTRGDTHDFLVSRVLQNEEALNDAQVLLKIWKHPGTKRKETRTQLGEAIIEKKRNLNSESDLAENKLFFEALFVAARESDGFSRFLTTLYN